MSTTAVARRYAKALYELSAEAGTVDSVETDLGVLRQAINEVDADSLKPGALAAEARQRIAERIAASVGPESLLARFIRVLAANDRLGQIQSVCEWFGKIRDIAAGRVRAYVKTATVLPAADVERLATVFSGLVGKQILPEVAIDDSLIAGVVVEVEGRVFDGSVRTSLQRLSERMAGQSGRPTT